VNLAFTLPPGAYATLVVKRLFHWTLVPGARDAEKRAPKPPRPPEPTKEERLLERRRTGFLAAKRARREARRKKPS
jgi:tRNA pseudouridine13 synthase